LAWLEGSNNLVGYLTELADKLKVKLELMVEVYDTNNGGKLIRYYQSHGFHINHSDFPDNFDFLNMNHNPDKLKDHVIMTRNPKSIT
jgi:hypothetical protein